MGTDGDWSEVLAPGTYRLSDGRTVTYTRADTANAFRQGNAMIRAGLRVPFAWGHDPRAVPEYLSDLHDQAWLARGYFADAAEFRLDAAGVLYARPRVKDPADLAQLKRVGTVSPRCQWDWRDETGHVWKGLTIGHVAATPRPIQRGQKPLGAYRPQLLSHTDPAGCRVEYLSHATRTGGSDMADEMGDTGGAAGSPQKAADLLKKAGLHLGTVASWDDFLVALEAAAATLHGPGDGDGDELDPDADGLAGTDTAAMPPALMSHFDAAGKLYGEKLEWRVGKLHRSGRIDGPTHTRLMGELKAADLSHALFDKKGTLKPLAVEAKIAAYEELPPGRFAGRNKAGDLSHADRTQAVPPPADLAAKDGVAAEVEDVKRRFGAA